MEIRIIKNAPGVVYEDVSEGIVLQVTEGKNSMGELISKRYELFFVNSNCKIMDCLAPPSESVPVRFPRL